MDILFGRGDVRMRENGYIEVEEIETLYREYCKETGLKFSKKSLARFLVFLKVDFFDWVNGNMRYFDKK